MRFAGPLGLLLLCLGTTFGFDDIRPLPRHQFPIMYKLRVQPYFSFPGYTYPKKLHNKYHAIQSLTFGVKKWSKTVVFHGSLRFENVKDLKLRRGRSVVPFQHTFNTTHSEITLSIRGGFRPKVKYTFSADFNAPINELPGGFYLVEYVDLDNKTKTHLATHFEPSEISTFIYSFNDPYYRAPLKLTVVHPRKSVVFSNGDVLKVTNTKDKARRPLLVTDFRPTQPLPSYQYSLVVGDFVKSTFVNHSLGFQIQVAAPPIVAHHLDLATEFLDGAFRVMFEWLPFKLNLFKLSSHVEVLKMPPSIEAMENAGLVIYQGGLGLHDRCSVAAELQSDLTLAHEVAHQWFGNLVTNSHWKYIYLHEAFASYYQFTILKGIYREKNVVILYGMGSIVIRMFNNVIDFVYGKNVWHALIKPFLTENAYGPVNTEIMISSFEKTLRRMGLGRALCGNLTLRHFVTAWLTRPRFPLVEVGAAGARVRLTQRSAFAGDARTRWPVPLLAADAETKFEHLYFLLEEGGLCGVHGQRPPAAHRPIVWNSRLSAPVLVRYAPAHARRLLADPSCLDAQNQLTLLEEYLTVEKKPDMALVKRYLQYIVVSYGGLLPHVFYNRIYGPNAVFAANDTARSAIDEVIVGQLLHPVFQGSVFTYRTREYYAAPYLALRYAAVRDLYRARFAALRRRCFPDPMGEACKQFSDDQKPAILVTGLVEGGGAAVRAYALRLQAPGLALALASELALVDYALEVAGAA